MNPRRNARRAWLNKAKECNAKFHFAKPGDVAVGLVSPPARTPREVQLCVTSVSVRRPTGPTNRKRTPPTRRTALLVLSALLFGLTVALKPAAPAPSTASVAAYYHAHLAQLHAALQQFQVAAPRASAAALQDHFAACRTEYKHLEFAVEYYYPSAAQRLNGAALPEAEPSEPDQVEPPAGFQVLEEYVYDPAAPSDSLRGLIGQELENLLFQVRYLQTHEASLAFAPADVFEAVRLNLYRLAAKGLAGFDSPTARRAVPEAAVTLESAAAVLAGAGVPAPQLLPLVRARAYVAAPGRTFAGFDRAAFFVRHYNPVLAALRQARLAASVPPVPARRAVRPDAASLFAPDAFDPLYFAPADAAPLTAPVLALGEALFQEPLLSGAAAGRSCASCHVPALAYTDGRRVNSSLIDGATLARNTPTLLNAALQPEQFADGRVHFLEDQVHAVVSNKAEMGGQLSEAPARLRRKRAYARLFAQAFPAETQPLTERNIRRAVAAYVRSLVRLTSRVDQFLRGDTTALSAQEIQGFNLFVGKAQCGTCHYAPLFSGAVPPLYDKSEAEVLGVPATADTLRPALDADLGKYALHGIAHQRRAFKTPTVRNAARTAPYMHNGVYQTLEQVVDFYNRGGSNGLGLDVENQTLPEDRLNLSAAEQQALVAFMEALTDK